MFIGIDYVLYTQKKQEEFFQEMKKSFSLWDKPYFVLTMKTRQRIYT